MQIGDLGTFKKLACPPLVFCLFSGMEEMILEEVQQFTSFLRKLASSGQPLDMASHFNLPILNALWRITVGDRFEYSDARLLNLIKRMGEFLKRIGNPAALLALTFPWIFNVNMLQLTILFVKNVYEIFNIKIKILSRYSSG